MGPDFKRLTLDARFGLLKFNYKADKVNVIRSKRIYDVKFMQAIHKSFQQEFERQVKSLNCKL